MRVTVKVCGISTVEAARAAVACGVDAIGLVFARSPRRVSIERAREIVAWLPPGVCRIAVFRYPMVHEVEGVLDRLACDVVQAELDPRIQALVQGRAEFLPVFHDHPGVVRDVRRKVGGHSPVLLEPAGVGGQGRAPSWDRAACLARRVPLVLAGGLYPGNVREAIARVRPRAVDVCSGVESVTGRKAPELIAAFMEEVARC